MRASLAEDFAASRPARHMLAYDCRRTAYFTEQLYAANAFVRAAGGLSENLTR
jgi:membrane-bound lytic murein transglycosylase B